MFCHERLDVYRVALDLVGRLVTIARDLPAGNADLRSQLRRAAMSITLNIAEGAGRFGRQEKHRFYVIARGSALECAAIIDLVASWKMVEERDILSARELLERVVAMLSALAVRGRES